MSTKRIAWIDSLRGVAMIAIILGHPSGNPGKLTALCYSFHVPLFFMISGALFHPEKCGTLAACLKKYSTSLLLPYFMLYSVNIPLWYINWRLIGDSAANGDALLAGLYYGNQLLRPMVNGALWFLPTLFLTTVASWILWRLFGESRNVLRICVLCSLVTGITVSSLGFRTLPWTLDAVPMCMFFFLLGKELMPYADSLSRYVSEASRSKRKEVFIVGVAVIAFGLASAMYSAQISGENVSLLRNDIGLIPVGVLAAAIISVGIAVVLIVLPMTRMLCWFGSNTLGSLAFHVPVMRFIENILRYVLCIPVQPIPVALAVIALMFPINWLVNRYAPVLVGKVKISIN